MRRRADDQSSGPATCATLRWPSSSSSRVAAAAPADLVERDDRHAGVERVLDRDERHVDQATVELVGDPVLRRR